MSEEVERLERDLRMAAEIGTSLLGKNQVLEQELQDSTERCREYEKRMEEVQEECIALDKTNKKLKVQLRKLMRDESESQQDTITTLETAKKEAEDALSSALRKLKAIMTEKLSLQKTVGEIMSQNEELTASSKHAKAALSAQVLQLNLTVAQLKGELEERRCEMEGWRRRAVEAEQHREEEMEDKRMAPGMLMSQDSSVTVVGEENEAGGRRGALAERVGDLQAERDELLRIVADLQETVSRQEEELLGQGGGFAAQTFDSFAPRALPAAAAAAAVTEHASSQTLVETKDVAEGGCQTEIEVRAGVSRVLGSYHRVLLRDWKLIRPTSEGATQTEGILQRWRRESREEVEARDEIDEMLSNMSTPLSVSLNSEDWNEILRYRENGRSVANDDGDSVLANEVGRRLREASANNDDEVELVPEDENEEEHEESCGIMDAFDEFEDEEFEDSVAPVVTVPLRSRSYDIGLADLGDLRRPSFRRPNAERRNFSGASIRSNQTQMDSQYRQNAMTKVRKGGMLFKYTRGGKKHLRFVTVDMYQKTISWSVKGLGGMETASKSAPVLRVIERNNEGDLSIIVMSKDRSITFEAQTDEDHFLWIMGMKSLFALT
ncbi:hypothetical protein HK101_002786, partial [Irineochytrium annulatum]